MPIVMGMVAGVFLPFGLDWIKAFETDLAVALSMTVAFLLLSALADRRPVACRRSSSPWRSAPSRSR